VTGAEASPRRFDSALLDRLDEPVQRYFGHALACGAPLEPGVRLKLSGQIRVGVWLRFTSIWTGDGQAFSWRATAGPGRLRLLSVHDQFASGAGSMDIRLRTPLASLPSPRFLHAENTDTTRSGAGRAALEALWTPAALLPARGVSWHAESEHRIVANWDVPPERPELKIDIAADGAVRSWWAQRWRDRSSGYVPFGAIVHGEQTFGPLTVPSRLTAGWGYGTALWTPFFRCEVERLEPASQQSSR